MTSPRSTSHNGADFDLDHFSKDQLRQLLDDDDYNEEALEFSDDNDDSINDGYSLNGEEEEEEEEQDDEDIDLQGDALEDADDDSELSDFEDSAESKQKRYQTLADLGFDNDDEAHDSNSDNDSDDEFTFRNALREARNFKVKRKRPKKRGGLAAMRRRMRRTELDPEVKLLLSQANEAFAMNELDKAIKIYKQVIKLDKNNFSAYKTLGEIYRMQNDVNRCSNIWLLAAHLNPGDVDFWKTVAELSVELGHFKQAIYCYRRAISASKGKDYDAIFSRACLYREVGKYKRASSGLLKIRSVLPSDSKIVRELAKVYVEEGRVNDAISLYTKILDDNVKYRKLVDKGESVTLENIIFDWSELNILSELYASKAAWVLGIKALRQVSRWIQEREEQTFWDENPNNDIEFDERRLDHPRFQKLKARDGSLDYSLPIDIRVQLGIFRLNNKQEEESLKHFSVLLDQPVEETPDLFFKVGMELESFGLFKEALEFLIPLSYHEEYNTYELVTTIARCLRETEDFENAKDTYIRLLEFDKDNVELKVALAECYFYLDDIEQANRLYRDAKLERLRERTKNEEDETRESILSEEEEEEDDLGFGQNDIGQTQAIIEDYPVKKKKKKRVKYTNDELKTMSLKSEIRVKKLYTKCSSILKQIEDLQTGDLTEVEEESLKVRTRVWIELVSDLITIFTMYKMFFPQDKLVAFNTRLRLRTAKLNIDQKLLRMKYLQTEIILTQQYSNDEIPEIGFKGLTYEQWYYVFVKYALLVAEFEKDTETATSVEEIIRHAIVFKEKELTTRLVGLSVGLLTQDSQIIMNQTRGLMNEYQFASDSFRLYLASFIPNSEMEQKYADAPSQKFLLRQIKAFDYLKDPGNDAIVGKATITKTNVDLSKDHFTLNYIYASYLFMNKSYTSALVYLMKLYYSYPNNPELLFLLSLANLHRSVQRKTLNSSFQVLQGLSYMMEYIKTKDQSDPYYRMEALYNLGRYFNLLGLDHIAVVFYGRVLNIEVDDSAYDLKKEAAHNLYTIYNLNGNHAQAEAIMDEYLVI